MIRELFFNNEYQQFKYQKKGGVKCFEAQEEKKIRFRNR